MTLEEAQIHLEYVKTTKPDHLKSLGITESMVADKALIAQAAAIATEAHWGADVSEQELFNRTLSRLIQERKLNE